MNEPPARCLDISRLISRAGRQLTGVDRVELAYLDALLARQTPLFGLSIMAGGYALVARDGLVSLRDKLAANAPWGPPDLVARLSRRQSPDMRRANSDLRRAAFATCPRFRLRHLVAQNLPEGTHYLNVGHSNLSERVLDAIRAIPGGRIAVLVHDLIPLSHPEFQKPGTVEAFEAKMRRVSEYADVVIANSDATGKDVQLQFTDWGRTPDLITAHLGIPTAPESDQSTLLPDAPYFVVLGTIEPRKNHAFLLDLWEEMGAEAPTLVVAGARGWNNTSVFERLDRADARIQERSALTDAQVTALLSGSSGLLMPSLAEGFGFPIAEAAQLGVPVIANDLAVYREFLPDIPVYVPVSDRYSWINEIKSLAGAVPADRDALKGPRPALPTWEAHFNRVLSVV